MCFNQRVAFGCFALLSFHRLVRCTSQLPAAQSGAGVLGATSQRSLTENALSCPRAQYVITDGDGTGCELSADGCVQSLGFPDPYPLNSSCRIHAVDSRFGQFEWFETEAEKDIFEVLLIGASLQQSYSGYLPGPAPMLAFPAMVWSADGERGHSEVGWRLCARSHCYRHICPDEYEYKAHPSREEISYLCEGPTCSTEADLQQCCAAKCIVGNHEDYAARNIAVAAQSIAKSCAEGSARSQESCLITCQVGYTFHGSLSSVSFQTCSAPGALWEVPTCLQDDLRPPFEVVVNLGETVDTAPCRTWGRDCIAPWAWPGTYREEDGERCEFSLSGDYIVKAEYFDLPASHVLTVNGEAYNGSMPIDVATHGGQFYFDYPTSDVAQTPGFLLCVFAPCWTFTCPDGYVFKCANSSETCATAVCGELAADVETCCSIATDDEASAGLATGSDAFNSGCLETTTAAPLTTTTTTTQPRQAIGSWQLNVSSAFAAAESNRETVYAAMKTALLTVAGLRNLAPVLNASNSSRRLTTGDPPVWVVAEELPSPLPSPVVNWTVGFQIDRLGHYSSNLEAATLPQLAHEFQTALGQDSEDNVTLISAYTISSNPTTGSPLESDATYTLVPYCADAVFVDDFSLTCEWWKGACLRDGTSSGFIESFGDPLFTFEGMLERSNILSPTALEACCACGGGICEPGSYILRGLQRGELPEFCAPCSPGRFTDEHDKSECDPCPVGMVTPYHGDLVCEPVAAGRYSNGTGLAEGFLCPLGTAAGSDGAVNCDNCLPGRYADEQGSTACKSCGLGTFTAVNGSTACSRCPIGKFASSAGQSLCLPCDLGSYSDQAGSTECRLCDAGTFAGTLGLIACPVCEAGSYADDRGQSACEPCDPGYVAGARRQEACTPCDPGTYAAAPGSSACTQCLPGTAGNALAQVFCQNCSAGRYQGSSGSLECLPCDVGTAAERESQVQCASCPEGTYFPGTGGSECFACEPGTFTDQPGQTLCASCAAGNFSSGLRQSVCQQCPQGTYSPIPGLSECLECALGRIAATGGISECSLCRPGSYADAVRMTSCKRCDAELPGDAELWTTMTLAPPTEDGEQSWEEFWGASSLSDCGCRPGSQPDGAAQINFTHGGSPDDPAGGRGRGCVRCGEGLTCMGMGQLRIWNRYSWDFGLSVYDCAKAIEEACPGGLPGVCKDGRNPYTVACAECYSGMVPRDDGSCEPCRGADYLIPSVIVVVAIVTVCAGYMVFDSPKRKRPSLTTLILIASAGQLLTLIQQLGIVSQIRVSWNNPLRRLFILIAEIGFLDINLLRPQCVAPTPPVRRYALRIFAVFFFLVIICLAHLVSALVQHRHRWQKRWPVLFCGIGTVVMAFFVSIVTTTLGPLQCKEHPNRMRTVAWFPSVLCWESDEHDRLVVIGIAACIVPLLFMSAAMWAVKVFKRKLLQSDNAFLTAWAFLVFRFHGDAYWFGPVQLVRNALVSAAPAMASPVLQIIFLQVVMLMSLTLLCRLMPWRAKLANYIDVCIHIVILFVTMVAAFYVEQQPSTALSFIAMICILTLPVALLVLICYAQIKKWRQLRRKKYQFFLCHHKAGAGCFARLMKMRLLRQKGLRGSVFVDTDDLKNLDDLFDMVAQQLETLVVLHSTYVLTRPWCIGEIVTTFMHEVKLQVLRFDGVEAVSDEFVSSFESHVADLSALTERGIDLLQIKEALLWLQTFSPIHFPPEMTDPALEAAAVCIVKNMTNKEQSRLASMSTLGPEPSTFDREEQVVILADKRDLEASATAFIMKDLINPVLQHEFHKLGWVLSEDDDAMLPPATAKAVLICTNDVFRQSIFEAFLHLHAKQCVLIPVMATSNFRFPTTQVLVENPDMNNFEEAEQETLILLVQCIFTEIAVDFQPAGLSATESSLAEKAKEVGHRLYKNTADLATKLNLMVNKSKFSSEHSMTSRSPSRRLSRGVSSPGTRNASGRPSYSSARSLRNMRSDSGISSTGTAGASSPAGGSLAMGCVKEEDSLKAKGQQSGPCGEASMPDDLVFIDVDSPGKGMRKSPKAARVQAEAEIRFNAIVSVHASDDEDAGTDGDADSEPLSSTLECI